MQFSAFDAISGLSGVGIYLLARRDTPNPCPALVAVLSALIELTNVDDGLPALADAGDATSDDSISRRFPAGSLNYRTRSRGPRSTGVNGDSDARWSTGQRLGRCRAEGEQLACHT